MFDGGGKYFFFLSGDEDRIRLSPSPSEDDRDKGRLRGPLLCPFAPCEVVTLVSALQLSAPDTVLRRGLASCGSSPSSMLSGSEWARESFSIEEVGDVDLARESRRLRPPPCPLPTGCLLGDDSIRDNARGRVGERLMLVPAREMDGLCLRLRLLPYVTFTGLLEVEGSPNVIPASDSEMGELVSCCAASREAFCPATRRDMSLGGLSPRSRRCWS